MKDLKEKLVRALKRSERKSKHFKELHGETPSIDYTYHGGWTLGYWEGRAAALDEILGFVEEEKEIE